MAKRSSKKARKSPAARLTDELIVEILSRLPVKFVCRFKCVCKAWRRIISDPEHRKKLPQTLAGFFYGTYNLERSPVAAFHFTNVSGRGDPLIVPSSFMPWNECLMLFDCCNGLLLFRHKLIDDPARDHFPVCNPATNQWTQFPDPDFKRSGKHYAARLGFDPAVSPHLHVFRLVGDAADVYSRILVHHVEVFSSETRRWVHHDCGWIGGFYVYDYSPSVFVNGCLHVLSFRNTLAIVDTEGKTWREIPIPDHGCRDGFIQKSQGRLHYVNFEKHDDAPKLAIYVLEDKDGEEWILKHRVMASDVFRGVRFDLLRPFFWVAIHPECNLIFFTVGSDRTLMSYDMDRKKGEKIRRFGDGGDMPCVSYVPFYSKYSILETSTSASVSSASTPSSTSHA